MTTFALIAEGITDQVVLETIICTWYRDSNGCEVEVNFLQPARDATDESRIHGFGGWEKVLEYCSFHDRIAEALAVNDYLIIHIDTDCCEHPNFGLNLLAEGGVEKETLELIAEVREIFSYKLGLACVNRVFFAVGVHSIDCWLLPLYADIDVDRCRKANCFDHLCRICRKKNLGVHKNYLSYTKISSPLRKIKSLKHAAVHSESLRIFLDSLP